jgi:hypothetical protein
MQITYGNNYRISTNFTSLRGERSKINQNECYYAKQTQFMPFLAPKSRFRQKTNPNKPNSNPIQTQNKAIFRTKNPPQSQNKPNQTQSKANPAR